MKRVYVKEEWCLGCRLCEYWCVYSGSGEKNFPFAFDGGATPPAGMQVEEVGPIHFAVDCRHCDDPLCLKGCISGALYRDGYGGQDQVRRLPYLHCDVPLRLHSGRRRQ